MAMGFAELLVVLFGLVFALAPLVVMIFVILAIFRRLDRIVAATEATANAVQHREERGGAPDVT